MKKNILICALLASVIAATAFAEFWVVSHREDLNPDFGLVKERYTMAEDSREAQWMTQIPVRDCTGDTDILKVDYISQYGPQGEIKVWFTATRDVALTAKQYENGALVDANVGCYSVIEHWENGEWVEYKGLDCTFVIAGVGGINYRKYAVITPEQERGIPFCLELGKPGKYRLTYYFRDSIDPHDNTYTTGEELYSISHTFTLPEASNKPFDLITLYLSDSYDGTFWVNGYIRANGDKPIYWDRCAGSIEKLVDGEWVESISEYSVYNHSPDSVSKNIHYIGLHFDRDYIFFQKNVAVSDPNGEYRVKVEFVSDRNEPQEHYTLTLPIDFSVPYDVAID